MIDTFADQSSLYDSRCARLLGGAHGRPEIIEASAGFLSRLTAIKKANCP
ncbi:hypothetical protein [Stutzerimonas kunmingensis]|nr:hypothetical protein [Stutzerimonas kunmingensis]